MNDDMKRLGWQMWGDHFDKHFDSEEQARAGKAQEQRKMNEQDPQEPKDVLIPMLFGGCFGLLGCAVVLLYERLMDESLFSYRQKHDMFWGAACSFGIGLIPLVSVAIVSFNRVG